MKTTSLSAPSLGSQMFVTQRPINKIAAELVLLPKSSLAQFAQSAARAAAFLVLIAVFSPLIVMFWLSTALDALTGRTQPDSSLSSLAHAPPEVEAHDESESPITAEQRAWISEMEDFDRF